VNSTLDDAESALSRHIGVNASFDTCYNVCDNATDAGWEVHFDDELIWGPNGLYTATLSYNCTTRCYRRGCIESCLQNCAPREPNPPGRRARPTRVGRHYRCTRVV
jgi:hypothetical protein